MGNLGYMIPTTKLYEFNRRSISKLILTNIATADVDIDSDFEQINIYHNKDNREKVGPVFTIYFDETCYLIENGPDEEEFISLRDSYPENEKTLRYFFEKNYQKNPCFSYTHVRGGRKDQKLYREIEKFLHQYFKAYIFDEGIHPEHIPPNYKWRS
jgi:hypothetical protein